MTDRRPPGIRAVLRPQLGRRGISREVDRELRAHLTMTIDELISQGMSRDKAEDAARRAFGDPDAIAAECRDLRVEHLRHRERKETMQGVLQDLRFAIRTLKRAPGFTVVAILTLALGIGANSAIFSALDAVLLRALPYQAPDELVSVSMLTSQSVSKSTISDLRERQHAFRGLGGYSRWGFTLTGSGEPEVLNGVLSTADLFTILGARPLLGRTFAPGEDEPGRNNVVVLSHGLWTRRFGADPGIIGRTINLDIGSGSPARTVIGVMPPSFFFPTPGRDAWIPTSMDRADENDFHAGYLLAFGRLRAGTSIDRANADLHGVVTALRQADSANYSARFVKEAFVGSLRDTLVGKVRPALLVLLGAVGLVLLIACVNVANLLLARATGRAREMTVRAALGAGRQRIVRLLLTESVLLAACGGVVGLLLAYWAGRVIGSLLPGELPRVGSIGMGWRVMAFGTVTSLAVGILFGLFPALRTSRADLAGGLRERGRGNPAGARGRRAMGALVVGEFAMALVLVVAAGLTLQSFWRLRNEGVGFDANGLLTFTVDAPSARYDAPERQRTYYDQVLQRLAAVPGVRAVGAVHLLPFGGSNWNPGLIIEGRTLKSGEETPEVDWRVATPSYFQTMRIPLIRGRGFTDADRSGSMPVTLVNAALVARNFKNEDPIGKRVYTFFEGKGNWVTIVGVVGDMRDQTLGEAPRPQMYRPYAQNPMNGMAVMLRADGDPLKLAVLARQAVWSVDRDVPIVGMGTMADVVSSSAAQPRLLMLLLGIFGALALSLGAIGIYGVISYLVAQRTPEIGVRMALGARGQDVVRSVVKDALGLAGVGVIAGILIALGVTRLLATQLYGIGSTDPLTFVAVALVLGAVAFVASWVPARRAARVDPTIALRG